jgi:hypothetical protein
MRLDPALATKYRARLIYIFFNYCCGFLKPGLTTPPVLFLEVHKSYLFIPPVGLRFGDRKTIEKISKDNATNFLIFFPLKCAMRELRNLMWETAFEAIIFQENL